MEIRNDLFKKILHAGLIEEILHAMQDGDRIWYGYDPSDQPSQSSDGGHYAYWYGIEKIMNAGFVEISYSSADFNYCPYCGSYDNHSSLEKEECIKEYFQEQEALEILRSVRSQGGAK